MRVTCPGCNGSGKINNETCTVCYGACAVDYPDEIKEEVKNVKS